jgi:beta-galactosidase
MSDSLITRRRFLQTATVATAATQISPRLRAEPAEQAASYPENGTLVPDHGWRLWLDTKAAWEADDIFLPEDIAWVDGALCGKGKPLPVNAPTGGWEALAPAAGIEVLLPTTVEQHFWGKEGLRPYTPEEYRYAPDTKGGTQQPAPPTDDDVPQNGAYFGVSWWWRAIEIPAAMRGKRIFLHVRGAHLRAEVYLNRKLVGYSIMEELPFECDLTGAANPGGENVLAIRITNPFGRFDWVDGLNAKWGHVSLYRSHGFGGMDRGMTISAHDGVHIRDAWVLNDAVATKIHAFVEVECPDSEDIKRVSYMIVQPDTGKRVGRAADTILDYNGDVKMPHPVPLYRGKAALSFDEAVLWDIEIPAIYHLIIRVQTIAGRVDTRTIPFGFRSFAPAGIGTNALFRLNGRRIRLYTSISWGFWGLNGMWPVPELAEKEVTQAKKLGLNCLNFHRNLAKEDVLRAHDRLGLLRYMEPGAGKFAIGKMPSSATASANSVVMQKATSEADVFAQRYMFARCVEMVKAYRSHPSVIEYCLQNEIGADLKNPATLAILEAMHDEDPSRCVVLNDGFVAEPRKAAQAWYEPWSDDLKEGKLHRSDKEPWGDWWNQHQGAGDQWYDAFYKSPTDYTYRAPFKNVLTEYGEMEGCARPDNHPLMVHQIKETYKKYGGDSYDLADHEEIIAGYETFLDKWGFRKAFPSSESLFLALGRTCYESWMNYLENARISDELDFAAISGWESTSIENHSGIVDNLRNFKSDPGLIAGSLLPVRPIAKQRALVVEHGKTAMFDLYLANDTPEAAAGTLTLTMIAPSGKRKQLMTLPTPEHVVDQFSYLLKEGFETPKLDEEGLYKFRFALSSVPLATQTKELWVAKLPINAIAGLPTQIGVSGITPKLRKQLSDLGAQFDVQDFVPGKPYHVIISSGLTSKTTINGQVGETTGESNPINAVQTTTELGHLQHGILEAVQTGTPLLAIPQADSLSEGVAKQLADAGAFQYHGAVGDFRAPWMGDWYFVREHAAFAGMPVDQAMGGFYQAQGRQSNGLLVDGDGVEVIVGYSRDHDRKVGAGTFTAKLGKGKVLFHRVPEMHPVMQQRFLANALRWLVG